MAFLAVVRIPWYGWKTIGLVTKSCCWSAAKIMSNSLESRELQHTRLPWLSSLTIFLSLLKLMSIELVMPSNHLILCIQLLLPPPIFSSIRVFSNESVLHIRWSKYWSFSISPSNEYSGLISFRIDWLVLFAVQRTLINSSALSPLYGPTLTWLGSHETKKRPLRTFKQMSLEKP